ncbi:hypothetical protein LSAT2_008299 [Lamellibrachia satsuma]|nr:hypothetical protein LSAT2_008299 [Lamellibrachia satsuma]
MIGPIYCVLFGNKSKRRRTTSSFQNGQTTSAVTTVGVISYTVTPPPLRSQPDGDTSPAPMTPPPNYSEVGLYPQDLPPPYPGKDTDIVESQHGTHNTDVPITSCV